MASGLVRLVIGAFVLILSAHLARSAVFTIANGDVAGLIGAINTANSNNEDDTINLATGGSYVLTTVDNTTDGANGLPVLAKDGTGTTGHALAINGHGATISRSSAAGTANFRLLYLSTGGPLTISNLILTNGSANGSSPASNGGAIYAKTGTITLNNCSITGNTASNRGGGIFNDTINGALTLNNCTLSNNNAASGGEGGAAIGNLGASLTVNGCTIVNNVSGGPGGALNIFPGVDAQFDQVTTLTNCTLSDNRSINATSDADAIFITSVTSISPGANSPTTTLNISSCTFDHNGITNSYQYTGTSGHAGFCHTILSNTILASSPLTNFTSTFPTVATITSNGYNLSTDNGGGFLTGTGDQTGTNPKLDPQGLQNNGGFTQTIALTFGSPAIDKGNSFGVTTDQRGNARPLDNPNFPNASGGDGADIGAYEAPSDPKQGGIPSFVVTTTADHDDGVCGGFDCSLREAINQANAMPANTPVTITFSVLGTITLNTSPYQLGITRSMTITGPNARNLVIGGNNAHRIFDISAGDVSISSVTIRDGNFVTDSGLTRQGGGVYSTATSLSFSDCAFINNTVAGVMSGTNGGDGGSGQGGAIFSTGNLSLSRCTFLANSATGAAGHAFTSSTLFGPGGNGGAAQGGAVFSGPGVTLSITNCTFTNNTVTGGNGGSGNSGTSGASGGNADGGAVCNLGTMTMTSATLRGNTGTGGAGANYAFQRHGPNGTGNGGVADLTGSTSQVANTIIAGNSGTTAPDAEGAFTSSGYNLIGIGDQSTGFSGTTKDQVGTTATPINPQLGGLRDNGGQTDTMVPLGASPAVDQGYSFGFTTDQRGQPRIFDEPPIPNASDGTDIGAVETDTQLGPTFVVGTTADHDDGICSVTDCTLREAINAANSASGPNTITFAGSVAGTITLEGAFGPLNISSDTTITGPGARTLAVSGNSATRVFVVSGGTSTISGLTIRDGFVMGFPNILVTGGGIVNSATLTLNDCALTNNHLTGGDDNGFFGGAGGAVSGGAIYNSATLTLNRCTFSGNGLIGGHGGQNVNVNQPGGNGGSALGAALYNDTNGGLSINDCTFNGNIATGGAGGNGDLAGPGGNAAGALFNVGALNLTAATISGNTGTGGLPGLGSNPFPGRGVGGVSATAGGTHVADTIVAVNIGNNGGGNDVSGAFTSSGYNLIGTATGSFGFTMTGDQTGTDTAKLDPKLGSLHDNGGQTDTMMLLINSPALDKGKSFGLSYDQRGMLRTLDSPVFANASGGDGTDIGAVEFYPLTGTDTDGDGMSDDFENFYGFNPNDPSDGGQDADGDGLTNAQEFQAGTNPRDPASGLRVIAIATNGNDSMVSFSLAVVGKSYRLERKDALADTMWSSITGVSDFSPISTGAAQISDPGGAATSKHFYRIRVLP